jgi:predicted dehydrogenase
MTAGNNDTPQKGGRLRVGLIAEADEADAYVTAVRACPELELCAQAGVAQQAAAKGVEWFDDMRVLIAQGGISAVIISASPGSTADLCEVAATEGVHVWMRPPLGRNFAEAVEVARRLQRITVVCRIGSWWDHVRDEIRATLAEADGREPVFSEIEVSTPGPPGQSWRANEAESAGGALACDGYPMLEALLAIRGLPESVVGAVAQCRRQSPESTRETEDIASAILRYEMGGLAYLRASWDIPPFCHQTLHHGRQASVKYDCAHVSLLSHNGEHSDERPLAGGWQAAALARFAAELRGGTCNAPSDATIIRHLAVSAVLEAVYLSARTEHPENPRRLFEVQKWPVPDGQA